MGMNTEGGGCDWLRIRTDAEPGRGWLIVGRITEGVKPQIGPIYADEADPFMPICSPAMISA